MPRITLVTGLKGAGKSSLVCSLLQAADGLRICVVVDNVEALELFGAGKESGEKRKIGER